MRYVEYAVLFCAMTETFKDQDLTTLHQCHNAPPHTLEKLVATLPPHTTPEEVAAKKTSDATWEALSLHTQATALAHVEV